MLQIRTRYYGWPYANPNDRGIIRDVIEIYIHDRACTKPPHDRKVNIYCRQMCQPGRPVRPKCNTKISSRSLLCHLWSVQRHHQLKSPLFSIHARPIQGPSYIELFCLITQTMLIQISITQPKAPPPQPAQIPTNENAKAHQHFNTDQL